MSQFTAFIGISIRLFSRSSKHIPGFSFFSVKNSCYSIFRNQQNLRTFSMLGCDLNRQVATEDSRTNICISVGGIRSVQQLVEWDTPRGPGAEGVELIGTVIRFSGFVTLRRDTHLAIFALKS